MSVTQDVIKQCLIIKQLTSSVKRCPRNAN